MEKGKVNMSTFKEGFIKYGQDHGYIKPKKKSETCDQQLRRMCKNIADDITNPKISKDDGGEAIELQTAHEWMEDVYDIQWITNQDHKYQGARLLVAGGGPNIWVNMNTHEVEGYWWGDHCKVPFVDNLQLDEYLEELHAGSK
jgi:hypothetical protein